MKIFLVRHGKTIANEKKLYCGKSDLELSEVGISELNELKKNIIYPKCNKYFTSGARRANETFEILYPNVEYKILKEFAEYDFGDFEMKSYEMLKENREYISWISDDQGYICCPNGESKVIYRKRIKEAFIRLVKANITNNINSILILCHGGTIGTILELFYDRSKSFYEHQPACGQGYKVDVILDKDNNIKVKEVEKI